MQVEKLCLRWNLLKRIENLDCTANTLTELDLYDNQVRGACEDQLGYAYFAHDIFVHEWDGSGNVEKVELRFEIVCVVLFCSFLSSSSQVTTFLLSLYLHGYTKFTEEYKARLY